MGMVITSASVPTWMFTKHQAGVLPAPMMDDVAFKALSTKLADTDITYSIGARLLALCRATIDGLCPGDIGSLRLDTAARRTLMPMPGLSAAASRPC